VRTALVLAVLLLAAPGRAPAQERAAADLARQGWAAVNAGRLDEASLAFGRALKIASTPPALLGAGLVAHLQGRYEEARQHLVAALAIDPRLGPASLLLGEVLYRSGDIDGAIATYEGALARDADNPQILKKLEAWRKEADLHRRFGQRFADHFTILFEGPAEAALAERAAAILEAAYWRIGTALYAYPSDTVTVVLYTREQFRDITQSPEWAGGAFDGRIRVPVQGALQNAREFERVLAHELTHAFVRSMAPRGVPTWFDEGLAVFFEGSDPARRRARVRDARAVLPFGELDGSFAGLDANAASLAYAQSAIAVRILMEDAGAPAVVNVLTDVGHGVAFKDAFDRHIPFALEELQTRVAADVR
jgi:tetratricopeptide (TPR) repeat protein